MNASKNSQKPQQTPFEKAAAKAKARNMILAAYALTLRAISESIKVSGTIDKQATDVLIAIANETEARLGISA